MRSMSRRGGGGFDFDILLKYAYMKKKGYIQLHTRTSMAGKLEFIFDIATSCLALSLACMTVTKLDEEEHKAGHTFVVFYITSMVIWISGVIYYCIRNSYTALSEEGLYHFIMAVLMFLSYVSNYYLLVATTSLSRDDNKQPPTTVEYILTILSLICSTLIIAMKVPKVISSGREELKARLQTPV